MADGSILIEIKGSAKEFVEALDSIKDKTSILESQLKFTAAASGIAFAALTAEVGFAAEAYKKQEQATNGLVQALQNQGIYSKDTVAQYREQAEVLQDLTGIDAEQIVQGQSLIQSMIGRTQVSGALTKAAVDLSTKTGDVKSAFEILGRGIEGNTKGLKQFGIVIDESLPKHERMAKIIELVTQKYGGQAEAAAQGLSGTAKLSAAFEDIQKEIGSQFAPVITEVTQKITSFLNSVAKNKPLVDLVAVLLSAGVAVTGFIATLGTLGIALTAATHIAGVFGFTLAAALGPIGIAAAAVAALGAAVGYLTIKSHEAGAEQASLEARVNNMRDAVARYQSIVDHPTGHKFVDDDALKNLDSAKSKLADLETQLKKFKPAPVLPSAQDPEKEKQAQKEEDEENARDARKIAALRAHNELVHLEFENASKDEIDLKKQEAELLDKVSEDKYKSERANLQKSIEETRALEENQRQEDLGKLGEFHEQVLGKNKEFGELNDSEQKEFLKRHQSALQASLETERTTREKAALAEAQREIKRHNDFLESQRKFGTAYAEIERWMNESVTKERRQALDDLSQLQQSSNAELKAIGKAAAVANITIKTAESAMNIFAGFSTIPIIGPALAVGAIAADIAFGAEQIANVIAAADGGLIEGGIVGKDSVPALLMPGELVTPAKNFDEVVNAVAAKRAGDAGSGNQSAAPVEAYAHIELSMKDKLVEFLEAKIIERQRIGISLLPRLT